MLAPSTLPLNIDMQFHWIRDRVFQKISPVLRRRGSESLADFFTKPLPVNTYVLGMRFPPPLTTSTAHGTCHTAISLPYQNFDCSIIFVSSSWELRGCVYSRVRTNSCTWCLHTRTYAFIFKFALYPILLNITNYRSLIVTHTQLTVTTWEQHPQNWFPFHYARRRATERCYAPSLLQDRIPFTVRLMLQVPWPMALIIEEYEWESNMWYSFVRYCIFFVKVLKKKV